MLPRLAVAVLDASLLATTHKHCAPRVPVTTLPAVGMEDGSVAPPPHQEVGLVRGAALPPHREVGLVGLRLLPLGVLLAGLRLLLLVGRARTSFLD